MTVPGIEVDGLDEQPCKLELHNEDCFGAFKKVKAKTVGQRCIAIAFVTDWSLIFNILKIK